MYAPERRIICSVPQIPGRVEWLLYTEAVILQQVPSLGLLGYQPSLTNGNHIPFVVEFMAVVTEELEKQLTESLLVFAPVPSQRAEVIIEGAD